MKGRSQSNRSGFETCSFRLEDLDDVGLNPTVVVLKPGQLLVVACRLGRLNPTVVVLKLSFTFFREVAQMGLNPTVVVLKLTYSALDAVDWAVSIQP